MCDYFESASWRARVLGVLACFTCSCVWRPLRARVLGVLTWLACFMNWRGWRTSKNWCAWHAS